MSKQREIERWRKAVRDSDLKMPLRVVLYAMSFYMHYDRLDGAYPGPARLAAETGAAASTVKAALRKLVALGWLEPTAIGGSSNGRRIATTYRGTYPPGTPVQDTTRSPRNPVTPRKRPVQVTASTRTGGRHHQSQQVIDQGDPCGAPLGAAPSGVARLDLPVDVINADVLVELRGVFGHRLRKIDALRTFPDAPPDYREQYPIDFEDWRAFPPGHVIVNVESRSDEIAFSLYMTRSGLGTDSDEWANLARRANDVMVWIGTEIGEPNSVMTREEDDWQLATLFYNVNAVEAVEAARKLQALLDAAGTKPQKSR